MGHRAQFAGAPPSDAVESWAMVVGRSLASTRLAALCEAARCRHPMVVAVATQRTRVQVPCLVKRGTLIRGKGERRIQSFHQSFVGTRSRSATKMESG
jgi:hypothetical protein